MKIFLRFFFAGLMMIISLCCLFAQHKGNIWYFGSRAGLDFNNDTLVALEDGQIWVNDNSSTICDDFGKLMFYTNSDTVWNKKHQIMHNGTGLHGSWTSGQCALIVPQPGTSKSPSQAFNYYTFPVS
jgi:hypothetical protein